MSVRQLTYAGLAALTLLIAGCSSGSNFDAEHLIQRNVEPGTALVITLPSNASLTLPANTFELKSTVIFSDELNGSDTYANYYPVSSENPDDRVASVVVNTPADRLISADISVRMPVRDGVTLTAGDTYILYRFDFDNQHWNRWGAVPAAVDSTGTLVDCVLPTTGFRGFIGSLAIFTGLTVASQPAVIPTVIQGTAVNVTGGQIAGTDVGVYQLVGALKYPVPVAGGRIPALIDPSTGIQSIVANTVDTTADGSFELVLPDIMIGQIIALEFGNEDTRYSTQTQFDVLPPTDVNGDYDNVDQMVVFYGENNVRSLGLRGN